MSSWQNYWFQNVSLFLVIMARHNNCGRQMVRQGKKLKCLVLPTYLDTFLHRFGIRVRDHQRKRLRSNHQTYLRHPRCSHCIHCNPAAHSAVGRFQKKFWKIKLQNPSSKFQDGTYEMEED